MSEREKKQKPGWVTYCRGHHVAIVSAGAIEVDFVLTKHLAGEESMSEEKDEKKELTPEEFDKEFEKAEAGAVTLLKGLAAEALKVEGLPDTAKGLLQNIQSGLGKLKGYGYPKIEIENTVAKAVDGVLNTHDESKIEELQNKHEATVAELKKEHQAEIAEIIGEFKKDFVAKDQVKPLIEEALKNKAGE